MADNLVEKIFKGIGRTVASPFKRKKEIPAPPPVYPENRTYPVNNDEYKNSTSGTVASPAPSAMPPLSKIRIPSTISERIESMNGGRPAMQPTTATTLEPATAMRNFPLNINDILNAAEALPITRPGAEKTFTPADLPNVSLPNGIPDETRNSVIDPMVFTTPAEVPKPPAVELPNRDNTSATLNSLENKPDKISFDIPDIAPKTAAPAPEEVRPEAKNESLAVADRTESNSSVAEATQIYADKLRERADATQKHVIALNNQAIAHKNYSEALKNQARLEQDANLKSALQIQAESESQLARALNTQAEAERLEALAVRKNANAQGELAATLRELETTGSTPPNVTSPADTSTSPAEDVNRITLDKDGRRLLNLPNKKLPSRDPLDDIDLEAFDKPVQLKGAQSGLVKKALEYRNGQVPEDEELRPSGERRKSVMLLQASLLSLHLVKREAKGEAGMDGKEQRTENGFDNGFINGIYRNNVKKPLERFQELSGLEVSGIADVETLKALNNPTIREKVLEQVLQEEPELAKQRHGKRDLVGESLKRKQEFDRALANPPKESEGQGNPNVQFIPNSLEKESSQKRQ